MKNYILSKPAFAMLLAILLAFTLISVALAAPPPNDDFDAAVVVPGIPFDDAIDTSEATTAFDDPECAGQGHTVWYAYTPAMDMQIEANTVGSSYDTTLSAYTGVRGALAQLACNDDYYGLQSRIILDVEAGETYYFMVGAYYEGPGGSLNFHVDVAPPPFEMDLVVNDIGYVKASTGLMMLSGEVICSQPAWVDLYGNVQQRAGRYYIRGYFGNYFECSGETPWTVFLFGENGIFKPGQAAVEVYAYGYTFGEYDQDYESLTVKFRGMKK